MARSVLMFKRLKNISEETWESISEANRLKQRTLLEEFELEAKSKKGLVSKYIDVLMFLCSYVHRFVQYLLHIS